MFHLDGWTHRNCSKYNDAENTGSQNKVARVKKKRKTSQRLWSQSRKKVMQKHQRFVTDRSRSWLCLCVSFSPEKEACPRAQEESSDRLRTRGVWIRPSADTDLCAFTVKHPCVIVFRLNSKRRLSLLLRRKQRQPAPLLNQSAERTVSNQALLRRTRRISYLWHLSPWRSLTQALCASLLLLSAQNVSVQWICGAVQVVPCMSSTCLTSKERDTNKLLLMSRESTMLLLIEHAEMHLTIKTNSPSGLCWKIEGLTQSVHVTLPLAYICAN